MANKLILLLFPFLCFGQLDGVPDNDVTEWKILFDTEWIRAESFYTSQSAGSEPSGTQRRYYDFRVIDGLIGMIQATGDLTYVDDLVWYVDRVKGLATLSADGYYDWPVDGTNYQLYDAHGWRNIFKFLYIANRYPDIKTRMTEAKYNEWVLWFKTNLWNKWVARGACNVMRSNVHMASHMASNMALWLSILENDASYLVWVDAWNDNAFLRCSSATLSGVGFRDLLTTTPNHAGAVWRSDWDSPAAAPTDITHANAEVQSVIHQYQAGYGGWTLANIQGFDTTINAIMDYSTIGDYSDILFDIDLTGSASRVRTFVYGWCMLGRFDAATQEKLERFSVSLNQASYYHNVYIGNMAYNEAFLEGTLVYPEFGEPGSPPIVNFLTGDKKKKAAAIPF